MLVKPLAGDSLDEVMKENPYREGLAKTGAIQDVWPWVLDDWLCRICTRHHVAPRFDRFWLAHALWKRLRRQAASEPAAPARLDSLLNAKRSVAPETQAWAKFEPTGDTSSGVQGASSPCAKSQTSAVVRTHLSENKGLLPSLAKRCRTETLNA